MLSLWHFCSWKGGPWSMKTSFYSEICSYDPAGFTVVLCPNYSLPNFPVSPSTENHFHSVLLYFGSMEDPLALFTLDPILQGTCELPSAAEPSWRLGQRPPAHIIGKNGCSWVMLGLHGQTVSTFASQATPFLSLGQGTWFPFCIGSNAVPGLLGVYGLEVTGLFLKRRVTKPFKGNVCRWELPCPPSIPFDYRRPAVPLSPPATSQVCRLRVCSSLFLPQEH